jgi:hypothetical protein
MMMRKIKNIKQLKAEKKRIKQQQEELENKIRNNWKDLKECLRPANLAKDAISSIFKSKTEKNQDDENIFKSSFAYGVNLLAKKFADKAREKLGKIFAT